MYLVAVDSNEPTLILKAQDPVVYLQSLKTSQAEAAEIITGPHTSLARFPWAERHFCTGIRRILWGALVCRQEEEENSSVEQEDVSFWTNTCKRFITAQQVMCGMSHPRRRIPDWCLKHQEGNVWGGCQVCWWRPNQQQQHTAQNMQFVNSFNTVQKLLATANIWSFSEMFYGP